MCMGGATPISANHASLGQTFFKDPFKVYRSTLTKALCRLISSHTILRLPSKLTASLLSQNRNRDDFYELNLSSFNRKLTYIFYLVNSQSILNSLAQLYQSQFDRVRLKWRIQIFLNWCRSRGLDWRWVVIIKNVLNRAIDHYFLNWLCRVGCNLYMEQYWWQ